jgi:hypothetical protein
MSGTNAPNARVKPGDTLPWSSLAGVSVGLSTRVVPVPDC